MMSTDDGLLQEGSRELEHELETQLEQAEVKTKDLKALTNRLQMENEQLRDKLEQCSRDYHFQVTAGDDSDREAGTSPASWLV